jgi:hypothetical protein
LVDYVGRGRLQDYLKLLVFVEPVGVLAIAPVGGAAAGLHVSDAIRLRSKDAQKCFRRHGTRTYFYVIGFLDDATAI